MKNKISALFFLCVIIVSGCSANGIDKSNPKKSAEYIKQELDISEEITEDQGEYSTGIKDFYTVGKNIEVIENDLNEISHINFSELDEYGIYEVLELVDFPAFFSFENQLENDKENPDEDDPYYTKSWSEFTTYENIGVQVSKTSAGLLRPLGIDSTKPYSIQVVYDEDQIELLREFDKKEKE